MALPFSHGKKCKSRSTFPLLKNHARRKRESCPHSLSTAGGNSIQAAAPLTSSQAARCSIYRNRLLVVDGLKGQSQKLLLSTIVSTSSYLIGAPAGSKGRTGAGAKGQTQQAKTTANFTKQSYAARPTTAASNPVPARGRHPTKMTLSCQEKKKNKSLKHASSGVWSEALNIGPPSKIANRWRLKPNCREIE